MITTFDIISLIIGILGFLIGIAGLIIGVKSYQLTIKTFKLAGSIEDAVRNEKLSTNLNANKKKLSRLIEAVLKEMQEGNSETVNRMAISNFREVLIELERYKSLFSENDKTTINNANVTIDTLSKKQAYNRNDCTDFEIQVQKIKSLINGVIL